MKDRANAMTFRIPLGIKNLSDELQSRLKTNKAEYADICPQYGSTNILWVDSDYKDILLNDPLFWASLINKEIVSFKNFNIRTKSDIIDTPNDGLSNDNSLAMFYYDDSRNFDSIVNYLSNEEYQRDFVLTCEYINNKSYIKDWVIERRIEGEFDMTKSVSELKADIINYYNLNIDEGV